MFDRLVRFTSRLMPRGLAVSDGATSLSFADLDRMVESAAQAIRAAAIAQPGDLVGVAIADSYRHLLVLLACARQGVPTASLLPHAIAGGIAAAGAVALIADDPQHDPHLLADDAWFEALFRQEPAATHWPRIDPQALGRVQLSSGTTGEPKAIALTWAQVESRIDHSWNRSGHERMLSLIGLESGALPVALVTLWRGGCLLIGPRNAAALARALPQLAPTGLLASPAQLAALLDALPPDALPLSNLRIAISGGRATTALRTRAALRLGGQVAVSYASSEAGVVTVGLHTSLVEDGAVGHVLPSTELEVVDQADRPTHAQGRIRIRGGDVATGYRNPSPPDAARFRDGWFYPGDLGTLSADGALTIAGREDELMNFGGVKFLPETIEDAARAQPGIADLAAFAAPDAAGNDTPWLAIVRSGPIDEAALAQALTLPDLPQVRIAEIDAIPRTALGKARRDALRDAVRAASKPAYSASDTPTVTRASSWPRAKLPVAPKR